MARTKTNERLALPDIKPNHNTVLDSFFKKKKIYSLKRKAATRKWKHPCKCAGAVALF